MFSMSDTSFFLFQFCFAVTENPWQKARKTIIGSLGREWLNTDRVKSGNFGHEVNSDRHL